MSFTLATTVSASQRSITIQHADGHSDRLALIRHRDGDVHWRRDGFAVDEQSGMQWERHDGRLTVADVLAAVPQCEREIERWTREELDDGADLIELDIFERAVRARALERLAAELAAAFPRAA